MYKQLFIQHLYKERKKANVKKLICGKYSIIVKL